MQGEVDALRFYPLSIREGSNLQAFENTKFVLFVNAFGTSGVEARFPGNIDSFL